MPPKNWFYGIDHANSTRIIKYFQENKIFDVYKFNDIDIFLKNRLGFKDLFKLIYFYFFFKIHKQEYVFALNSSYIIYCNLAFKKRVINFFSQILNIKCILRWDHLNEQIPNIVESILKKSQFYEVVDYKKFFLEKIDNINFNHYTWQKDEYFCEKNFLENKLELKNFKLRQLNFFFTNERVYNRTLLNKKNNLKTVGLVGIINQPYEQIKEIKNLALIINDKKKFFEKKYYKNLIDYSNYEYLKKKNDIMQIENTQFYGLDFLKNKEKILDADNFFSEVSKFFIVINPSNPISLTITPKFYQIFLHGGFCINELPSETPPKLKKFKEYIFYEDINDLKKKIEFFKNNLSVYYSIKQEIYEISENLKKDTHKIFFDEFIK